MNHISNNGLLEWKGLEIERFLKWDLQTRWHFRRNLIRRIFLPQSLLETGQKPGPKCVIMIWPDAEEYITVNWSSGF